MCGDDYYELHWRQEESQSQSTCVMITASPLDWLYIMVCGKHRPSICNLVHFSIKWSRTHAATTRALPVNWSISSQLAVPLLAAGGERTRLDRRTSPK